MACGLIAGTALLFRVYQVAPHCLAAFIFLLIRQRPLQQRIKETSLLIATALVPVLITVIIFFDIAGIMFKAIIIDAPLHGTSLRIPYWDLAIEGWNKLFIYYDFSVTQPAQFPLKGIVFIFSGFLSDLFIRLIPFIVFIFLLNDFIYRRSNNLFLIKIFFVIWGICYLPYALNLSGNDHIVQAFLPFLIVLCLYIYEAYFITRPTYLKYLAGFCVLIVTITATSRVYLVYKPMSENKYLLQTETGSLVFIDEHAYRTFRDMTDVILANTKKGEYIFSLCWKSPPFYALTERKNPTYYDSPVDLLLQPAALKQQTIINDLKRTETKLVLVETAYSLTRNNDVNAYYAMPILMGYVKENYTLYRHYSNYEIYLLKQ